MLRCTDCFDVTPRRVPNTTICPQCYCDRCAKYPDLMGKRPKFERSIAFAMARHLRRSKELELANRLQREWQPPLAELLKEAG